MGWTTAQKNEAAAKAEKAENDSMLSHCFQKMLDGQATAEEIASIKTKATAAKAYVPPAVEEVA